MYTVTQWSSVRLIAGVVELFSFPLLRLSNVLPMAMGIWSHQKIVPYQSIPKPWGRCLEEVWWNFELTDTLQCYLLHPTDVRLINGSLTGFPSQGTDQLEFNPKEGAPGRCVSRTFYVQTTSHEVGGKEFWWAYQYNKCQLHGFVMYKNESVLVLKYEII